MLYTIDDDCGYTYEANTLLALYAQILLILDRVNIGTAGDFKVTSTPNTSTEQLAAIFANSPLRDKPRIEMAEVPTKTTLVEMLAHLRKQANRKEMGMFQYLTWADCKAGGTVMPTMTLLVHKPGTVRCQINDLLPIAICTIEDIEDYAFAHNRKEDASWCVIPATWNGTQWTAAGVFSEYEWMTKSGWAATPAADKNAPRWMPKGCLRYSVHIANYTPQYKGDRGKHIATFYGQGQFLAACGTWGYNGCEVFVERWNPDANRFDKILRNVVGNYLAATENGSPIEDLDSPTEERHFC